MDDQARTEITNKSFLQKFGNFSKTFNINNTLSF